MTAKECIIPEEFLRARSLHISFERPHTGEYSDHIAICETVSNGYHKNETMYEPTIGSTALYAIEDIAPAV